MGVSLQGEMRSAPRASFCGEKMAQWEPENKDPSVHGNPASRDGRLIEIRGAAERRIPRLGGSGIRDSGDESKFHELLPAERAIPRPDAPAKALTSASPALTGPPEHRKRCDLLIEAGEAKNRGGNYAAAQDVLRKAAELADRFQDQDRLVRIVAALPGWHWLGPGQSNPLALLLAQRALAVERENSCRRAILMARVAAELSYFPSQQPHSRELAAAAIDLAAGKDPQTELHVRLFRDPLLREPERAAERFQNAEEIVRLAVEIGDYAACFLGGLAKSASLSLAGNLTRAHEVAEVTAEIVSVSGSPLHRGIAIAWDLSRAVMEGRLEEAEKAFSRCRKFAAKSRIPHLLDACWPAMLMPLSEADRIREIEDSAEDTVQRRPGALVFHALLSWIKIRLGKSQDASFLLDRLAADDYLRLSQSDGGWVGIAALAEVCIALNRIDDAAALYKYLSPYAEFTAVLGGIALFGSVEMYLGELAAAMGRLDEAVRHFEKSFAFNRRIGARPWVAYSRWALARTLVTCGGARNCARAAEVLDQLEGEADRLQMKRLLSLTQELGERIRVASASPTPPARLTAEPHRAVPESGHRRSAATRLAPEPGDSARSGGSAHLHHRVASFRRKGDFWELGFQGQTFWLRHCRGFDFIHFLLRNAGQEFAAIQVVHQGQTLPDTAAVGNQERAQVRESAAPILDAQAKQAYRARLRELAEDLEDARQANDVDRAETIEEEKEFLARELARALGLFDRDRKFSTESDRARKCVRMAISRAIASMSRRDGEFAKLLVRSIRTGNVSSFVPRAENAVRWRL